MSDVLRFRVARSPQLAVNKSAVRWNDRDGTVDSGAGFHVLDRRPAGTAEPGIGLSTTTLGGSLQALLDAQRFTLSNAFVGLGGQLQVPVRELDLWLTGQDNHVPPDVVKHEMGSLATTPPETLVTSALWRGERQRTYESLLAAMLVLSAPLTVGKELAAHPGVGAELMRLLLVFRLAEDLYASPSPIATAEDVEAALRYRTVAIPPAILDLVPRRARLARRYGFSDLYVVRDEWNRYEAGEIAHIENVLPKETKKRVLTTFDETEAITSTNTEVTSTEEHDSQTTDRMEIQQHAQSETDMAIHVAAQVEVQAQYGPMVHIGATVGGSFDYSKKDTEDHAYQQAHEIVTRAVKSVEERVTTAKMTRTLQRTTQQDRHALTNDSTDAVVGIYRWVDKVQRMQMFRYPHRMLLEFEIPEPATFLRWRRSQAGSDVLTPDPVPLVRRDSNFVPVLNADNTMEPLQPQDVKEDTYGWWVAHYNVVGVSPPPPERTLVTAVLELKQQAPAGAGGGDNSSNIKDSLVDKTYFDLVAPGGGGADQPGVAIPAGYRLGSWAATGLSSTIRMVTDTSDAAADPQIYVMVGNEYTVLSTTIEGGFPPYTVDSYSGEVGPDHYPAGQPVTGTVQVTGEAVGAREFRVHVTLECLRMDAALRQWQQQTYEQVAAAYWAMKRQHADEVTAQQTSGGVVIDGGPPARNQEIVAEELKRGVIEMLSGQPFRGRDALESVTVGSAPQVAIDEAVRVAPEVQFIEQAFEWENLAYVLYPYFWAAYGRWPELADLSDGADPEFSRFLRSGSARVVVPARPKFETQVSMYVDFGLLWGGGPVPTVDDPDYLSVAAEIEAQQNPPDDGEKGRSWEVRLPTTLVWLDSDSSLPKSNPSPVLDAPPGP